MVVVVVVVVLLCCLACCRLIRFILISVMVAMRNWVVILRMVKRLGLLHHTLAVLSAMLGIDLILSRWFDSESLRV
jgi:hypothetical protein